MPIGIWLIFYFRHLFFNFKIDLFLFVVSISVLMFSICSFIITRHFLTFLNIAALKSFLLVPKSDYVVVGLY